jgi:hypothetical protein
LSMNDEDLFCFLNSTPRSGLVRLHRQSEPCHDFSS